MNIESKLSDGARFFLNRLDGIFPKAWLMEQARESGLVKRLRQFDPVLVFWTLVLQTGVHTQVHLDAIRRDYNRYAKDALSHSSFYGRFTPELVKFLHRCMIHGLEELGKLAGRRLSDRLARFKDLLIQDSTIIRVHEKLAKIWPAVRARKVAAGVKLACLVSVVSDGPKRVQLFGERAAEAVTLRLGPWVRDRILLMDLGFYKFQSFARIQENGGYFVTRVKDNANPLVTQLLKTVRGRSVPVVGERLRDVLPRLKRDVLDVLVEVSFRRRAYGGSKSGDEETFRVVAVHDADANDYHVYITNLSADQFTAEEIASLYRCRWEVELLFREVKDKFQIDKIPTANRRAVEALLWTGILTLTVHRFLFLTLRERNPERAPHYSHERSARAFQEHGANDLLHAILDHQGIKADLMDFYEFDDCGAFNPHRKTGVHMGDWLA